MVTLLRVHAPVAGRAQFGVVRAVVSVRFRVAKERPVRSVSQVPSQPRSSAAVFADAALRESGLTADAARPARYDLATSVAFVPPPLRTWRPRLGASPISSSCLTLPSLVQGSCVKPASNDSDRMWYGGQNCAAPTAPLLMERRTAQSQITTFPPLVAQTAPGLRRTPGAGAARWGRRRRSCVLLRVVE